MGIYEILLTMKAIAGWRLLYFPEPAPLPYIKLL